MQKHGRVLWTWAPLRWTERQWTHALWSDESVFQLLLTQRWTLKCWKDICYHQGDVFFREVRGYMRRTMPDLILHDFQQRDLIHTECVFKNVRRLTKRKRQPRTVEQLKLCLQRKLTKTPILFAELRSLVYLVSRSLKWSFKERKMEQNGKHDCIQTFFERVAASNF